MGEISAGFHHYGRISRADDVEAELAARSAEGCCLRVPQYRRGAAKSRTPARGPRQIIDRQIGIIKKYPEKTKAGSIPLEIESGQICAIRKGIGSYVGNAVVNCDAGQFSAIVKDIVSDAGDTIGNHDPGEPRGAFKCTGSNIDDAIANNDIGQVKASVKRIVSDVGDAVGNCDVGQSAKLKGIVSDAGNTIADFGVGQPRAIPKCIGFDVDDSVRNH